MNRRKPDIGRFLVQFSPIILTAMTFAIIACLLAGCATAPAPTPTSTKPVQSDALSQALDRIGSRTASQATSTAGRNASSSIYTATGGSFVGQVGSAAVRNTASEIQRWWGGR